MENVVMAVTPNLAPENVCREQAAPSPDRAGEARAVPMLVAWLVFYAIAIVGALTGMQPTALAPAMAVVVEPPPAGRAYERQGGP
jgi:hypothetical protein